MSGEENKKGKTKRTFLHRKPGVVNNRGLGNLFGDKEVSISAEDLDKYPEVEGAGAGKDVVIMLVIGDLAQKRWSIQLKGSSFFLL